MNHSKSGPFKNRTKIDHLKSGHVQISDPTVLHFEVHVNPGYSVSMIVQSEMLPHEV